MCGIIGIISNTPAAPQIYDGLVVLQHRGQDAAGIITYDGEEFYLKKGEGLVSNIFEEKDMLRLKGGIGIGHNRYPTAGSGGIDEAQPFLVTNPYGIAIAHNGNIYNFDQLKKDLYEKDLRMINSRSDSELIMQVFASALEKENVRNLKPQNIWNSVRSIFQRTRGAFALIMYIAGQGMVAVRDPFGIKPLVWGRRTTSLKEEYIFASESVVLDVLGYEKIRDVKNGEAIFINKKSEVYTKQLANKPLRPCMFEYIYFARPDSIIDDVSVYKTRIRLGEYLANRIKKEKADRPFDRVIPVPESARTCAYSLALKLKKKYREGLVKNRYIGRTFIMPGQRQRQLSIRRKLNAQPLDIRKRDVLLVDDSIVRGNTSRKIVQMVRQTGAKKVFFASSAPPIRFPCFYGIDFPTRKELIAHGRTEEEVGKLIDADKIFYQNIAETINSVALANPKIKKPCMACFDGEYPTPGITEEIFREMEMKRDMARQEMEEKRVLKEKEEQVGMF